MEEIKIKKRNGKEVVSARDLYNLFNNKKDFVKWAFENIENKHFTKGKDFFKENEYEVTISTAKSLLMFELEKCMKEFGKGKRK